jgi:hypothetical protein
MSIGAGFADRVMCHEWQNGEVHTRYQVQLDVHYILDFFLDNVSSTCFGCYLHPSSGAQLQRTAIGCVWF